MITEQGTNIEHGLSEEFPTRSVPPSEVRATIRRKPRRHVTVPTNRVAKLRTSLAWSGDARGQAGAKLDPESESLASLVRRRRTAWTAEELAEVLSLSRKHIYKMAKKGRMPSLRIGGAIRFDPHTTAAWLESKAIQ